MKSTIDQRPINTLNQSSSFIPLLSSRTIAQGDEAQKTCPDYSV
jgi:hypothetical protein